MSTGHTSDHFFRVPASKSLSTANYLAVQVIHMQSLPKVAHRLLPYLSALTRVGRALPGRTSDLQPTYVHNQSTYLGMYVQNNQSMWLDTFTTGDTMGDLTSNFAAHVAEQDPQQGATKEAATTVGWGGVDAKPACPTMPEGFL